MNIKLAKNFEVWPIDKLQPYEKNARTHSAEQVDKIAASIIRFGFNNPILVDTNNGIVAGHGRLMAAKQLGLTELPIVILTHLSDADRRAYIMADNKLAELAGWDEGLLASELRDLRDEDFDLSVIGFSDEELKNLIDFEPEELPGSGDEVSEPPVVPVSKTGDLWILGRHRLLCGDATKIDDAAKVMGTDLADLIVTDPPYNVNYEGKTSDSLKIENDAFESDEDFYQFLLDSFISYFTFAKAGAALYVFHADSEGLNFRRAYQESGFELKQCCIWAKNVLVMGRQDYHWQHEPILYGWKPGAAHNWYSDRKQTTLWNFNKPTRNGEHPTMKPIDLIEYPITNSSKKSDIVLDFFGGSGSTLIACEKTFRQCRTMELDPRYVDVIVKRWQDMTGKEAVLDGTVLSFNQMKAERDAKRQD